MIANHHRKFTEGSPSPCKRCNIADATLQIRADPVCQKCFTVYVTTKAVKRMETYRARGALNKAPEKLLLPISFGPSSTCLLHILDNQQQAQLGRMGRTAYELIVVHVQLLDDDVQESNDRFEKLKERFPEHKYIISRLGEALNLENIDWVALGLEEREEKNPAAPVKERLQRIMALISSVTSKADVASTLLLRLLVSIAKQNGCQSILFGDSTTRLAEKTLTETAKGRGFSLPWQVSDGMSPYGVNFHYPLRDLLKKELLTYSSISTPSLTSMIVYQSPSTRISASSKSTTIDDLMAQYFENVEENYPSIVANVVRTSSKLNPPPNSEFSSVCNFCGLPVLNGTNITDGWSGDQSSVAQLHQPGGSHYGILCYGCSRSING